MSKPERSLRTKTILCLTNLAQCSTPFISTFLLIHLSAPVLANIGGSSLSSRVMLLGREYYQTDFGERYLILGPLAVHALSGLAKRVLLRNEPSPRPWSSLHSVTGYAIGCLFLPVHFLTHRRYPCSDVAPIYAVGPSELDYEFVKLGLQKWPWRSYILYTGLVVATALHVIDGLSILWNSWFKNSFLKRWKKSNRSRAIILGSVALPVLTGIYTLMGEPLYAFASTLKRYEASFLQSLAYRI